MIVLNAPTLAAALPELVWLLTGEVLDHETQRPYTADELLEEWTLLRDDGHTVHDAAPRLGISPDRLQVVLRRATRAGDPRGGRLPFGRDLRTA